MEAMSSEQPVLSKLRIKEEICRRDSITSSRTAESGYHSDPDISLSPLDFVQRDQPFVTPHTIGFPPTLSSETLEVPALDIDVHSRARRAHRGRRGLIPCQAKSVPKSPKPTVTSNPNPFGCSSFISKVDWTNPFNCGSDVTITSSWGIKAESLDDRSAPLHNNPKERISSIASISSSGSGGDYSITDDSDTEESFNGNVNSLSKTTLTTLNLIMRKIEMNLNYAAYVQHAGGSSSGKREMPSGPRSSVQASSGKRKVRGDEGLQPDGEGDEGSNKRRRVSITTTEDSETGPRFACPFYKHDPNRYRNRRTCPGPGWPTVHRMKEHLYRSHAQPIYCPRCYTMFDADSDLSKHLRSQPCQISEPQPIDGIDRKTLELLHKRSPPLRLEEDKWRAAYQLLFPSVSELDIPSPYYDDDSPTEESRRFRRELLRRIQEELFNTAEREGGAVEQRLLRQVANIIRHCERELLDSFHPSTSAHLPSEALEHLGNAATVLESSYSGSVNAPTQQVMAQSSSSTRMVSSSQSTRDPITFTDVHSTPGNHTYSAAASEWPTSSGQEHQPSAPIQPSYVPWDLSEWIDWNAVFPTSPALQLPAHDQSVQPFSVPVET